MRLAIQLVLGIVIAIGAYALYRTITDPWNEFQAKEFQTEMTRARMDHIRTALIEYRGARDTYPSTLDSLELFVRTDSAYMGEDLNATFPVPGGGEFMVDSLSQSPRTGQPFEYRVVRNDSTGVEIYYLKDPDSEDFIGAETPDPARRNAASWE